MKSKLVVVVTFSLLLVTLSILTSKIEPVEASSEETVVHYVWSAILDSTTSFNDNDPSFETKFFSGKANMTFSSPDAYGVINLTIPKESRYTEPVYEPIYNRTTYLTYTSDLHGKLYTNDSVGDVDIISITNDTGTFFKNCTDGTWHPAGEEWLGNGDPDPAGSAWLTVMLNTSIYRGNGTHGPLLGSWLSEIWYTTGYSENTVVEPASRLDGCFVNATGVPYSPPYVGTTVTFVITRAQLNIPYLGAHLDFQSKTDQLTAEPPAFMATLLSPANLYVTDPNNKHIGTHPTTEEEVNEIPNAFYSGSGTEPQRIVIPNPLDGVYDIRIIGTDNGSYTSLVEYATDEKMTTHSYSGNISDGETLESQATISEGEMTSTPPSTPAVGGISIPVNKLELLAPYVGLTILLAVAVIAVVYVKKRKRNTEISS